MGLKGEPEEPLFTPSMPEQTLHSRSPAQGCLGWVKHLPPNLEQPGKVGKPSPCPAQARTLRPTLLSLAAQGHCPCWGAAGLLAMGEGKWEPRLVPVQELAATSAQGQQRAGRKGSRVCWQPQTYPEPTDQEVGAKKDGDKNKAATHIQCPP